MFYDKINVNVNVNVNVTVVQRKAIGTIGEKGLFLVHKEYTIVVPKMRNFFGAIKKSILIT